MQVCRIHRCVILSMVQVVASCLGGMVLRINFVGAEDELAALTVIQDGTNTQGHFEQALYKLEQELR